MPKEKRIRKSNRKSLSWSRLDNAAKIFPPTSHGSDTGVFRLSCELAENVRPPLLQQALDETLLHYPHMLMVMRRGVFWYYLEQTTTQPRVVPEHAPPCTTLYAGSRSLLFEVTYWRHKINLEMFHVLADGSGGIAFFRALLTAYLALCHPEAGEAVLPEPPVSRRRADSFQKYYKCQNPHPDKSAGTPWRAYRLRGVKRADRGLTIIEGVCSAKQVLEAAHRFGTTLTVYLTAVLFSAIHDEMYVRDEKRPVVITVPVDLRAYFPSETTRNFFGTIRVSYDFRARSGEFDDIIEAVAQSFRTELTQEKLAARMNKMASLEHNLLLRPIPLVIKNPVLRLSGDIAEMGETVALSNVGRFPMPEPLRPFIRGFGAFMTTHATQLVTCTFGDSLHLGFTSAFDSPDVQRNFFTRLTEAGVAVEVRSNELHREG